MEIMAMSPAASSPPLLGAGGPSVRAARVNASGGMGIGGLGSVMGDGESRRMLVMMAVPPVMRDDVAPLRSDEVAKGGSWPWRQY